MRAFATTVLLLLLAFSVANAQTRNDATEQGAWLVSIMGSFSSDGGDLNENFDGDRLNTISLSPTALYFVGDGLAFGGDVAFARSSQGDASVTIWGIGPQVGYFFPTEGNAIPYLNAGFALVSVGDQDDSETGWGAGGGAGILITRGHLGVAIEATYQYQSYKFEGASESTTGNSFGISIGLVGLLF